jgi:hypothetical protein
MGNAADLPPSERATEAARLRVAYAAPIKWVPRLLGFACFAAIGLGLWLARENLRPAAGLPLIAEAMRTIIILFGLNMVAAAGFVGFILFRRQLFKTTSLPYGIVETGPLWLGQLFSASFWRNTWRSRAGFIAELLAAGMAMLTTVSFALVFVDPFLVADQLPRALFLVFLLGAWVLGLTYLAALSHKLRAPVLLTLAFGLQLLATFSPRFHDVRLLAPGDRASSAGRQLAFATAVERWMGANGCAPDRLHRA